MLEHFFFGKPAPLFCEMLKRRITSRHRSALSTKQKRLHENHESARIEGGHLVQSMPLEVSGYLTGGACQTRIAEEEARAALAIPAA
jgi:hypothetical protein